MFYNIFHNACDAMARRRHIKLRFKHTGQASDHEMKIPARCAAGDYARLVSKAFASYGKEQGTGLGLSICKKIVEDSFGQNQLPQRNRAAAPSLTSLCRCRRRRLHRFEPAVPSRLVQPKNPSRERASYLCRAHLVLPHEPHPPAARTVATRLPAGEVGRAPASVVKKNVERLDAQAIRVHCGIQAGGRSLIRVTATLGMKQGRRVALSDATRTSKIRRAKTSPPHDDGLSRPERCRASQRQADSRS